MKAVSDALGVSRSNLVRRAKGESRPRQAYRMAQDTDLLVDVHAIIEQRPTYGYRRVTAILNRLRRNTGLAALNHKRLYRLMRQHNLLLRRHTGKAPGRLHEGKVITLRSNLRWASDGFEIPCASGEVVRVTFAIDTCDREIIAWTAATAGFTGESVRDLMLL